MTFETFDFEKPEIEEVDAYINTPNFEDALAHEEDLWDSDNESISKLLRHYSFNERPEVYQQKLKEIGDYHLTHLEDIDLDTLSRVFQSK